MSKVSTFLRSNASAPAKKSSVPSESVDTSLVDRHVAAKIALTDAEAVYAVVDAELLGEAGRIYAERAQAGNFAKSMNLEGAATPGVQVVYTDRFTAVEAGTDQEAQLREAVGNRFDAFFEEKRTLTLEKTDDATIATLIEKLGEETFTAIFKIRVQIAPKEGFDKLQFELPPQVRSIVKQSKASVRLRKE